MRKAPQNRKALTTQSIIIADNATFIRKIDQRITALTVMCASKNTTIIVFSSVNASEGGIFAHFGLL
jgi:hypothetical protein